MNLLDYLGLKSIAKAIPHSRENLKNAQWETMTVKEVIDKNGVKHVLRTYTVRRGRYR